MTLDVGRLTRLKAAVDNTATMKAGPTSAAALATAARQYRAQVADALDGDLRAEFESLFPVDTKMTVSGGLSRTPALVVQAAQAEEGRATLLGISGWLAGLVKTEGK
jgi:hypothetical protein